jgi:glycosyltransferase involved in cell wall biosynthesis
MSIGVKMAKKIKVLTLSDHPLFSTGVAIQTKLFIESMLQTGKFEFVSLAGAKQHRDMSPIKTEQYGDDWKIFPVEGYGNVEMVRSVMRTERPDVVWLMTDPRYYEWLWKIEDEIRAQASLVYYHVWDNDPAPHYNKKFYDSNDLVVSISKLTERVVNEVGTKAKHVRIPHTVDQSIYKILPEEEVAQFRKEHFGEEDKIIFFWNNRNAPRKNATTLLWWFKEFLDDVGHDKASLLVHTNPDDPMGTDLEANLKQLGLQDGQVMLSHLKYPADRMAMLYNVSDCTINISDAEGFGLATLESMACGTPILVNETGGLTEQIRDEENEHGVGIKPSTRTVIGSQRVPYIYQDRVSKEDFISGLKKICLMSGEERKRLGQLGHNHVVRNYNSKDFAESWEKALTNIYKTKGSWKSRKHQNWEIIEL